MLQALESENEPENVASPDAMDQDQRRRKSGHELLWVGGLSGMEVELVQRRGLAYAGIPAAGVHGVGLRALPGNLWQVGRGLIHARRILNRFRPDVMLFTGGFLAVPVALANEIRGMGAPAPASLLYVPDIEPGWALKILARLADRIAVTVPESRRYFDKEKVTVVGYPTRRELKTWDRATARETLNLSAELPVLLVIGGSTGARSINRAVLAILPQLLEEMQVVHIAGKRDWNEVEIFAKMLTDRQLARYRPYPYLHGEIGAALSAADLVLSRAGASSIGEYPLFGLPAILVPYPYAWRYQEVNARYLVERGAATLLADQDLPERLLPTVRQLMGSPEERERMGKAMSSLARPDAAKSIVEMILGMAAEKSKGKV